jgi:predicted nucleic acid-binding protein
MIVLDTNVLSEGFRLKPADAVRRWLRAQPPASLFMTTISEAEIFYGVALTPRGGRRAALEQAATAIFGIDFMDRILPFDSAAARAFAEMAAARRGSGRPVSHLDAQIAAISRSRGAALATRNIDDFADFGIEVINPWQE